VDSTRVAAGQNEENGDLWQGHKHSGLVFPWMTLLAAATPSPILKMVRSALVKDKVVRVCRLSESVVMIERPRRFSTRLRGMGSSCKR
jgi:hypothetical protein